MFIIASKGLQRMLSLLGTIWRLPEKHENSRFLITVLTVGGLFVTTVYCCAFLNRHLFIIFDKDFSRSVCLCSWLAKLYFSFSIASAIFQTGSGVSGGLFGCKMAASMD